jgi:hypothetical protein
VSSGELEVDNCPGKFITPDAITGNTPEALHRVHANSTMYNAAGLQWIEQGGCKHCIRGAWQWT